MAVLFEIFDRRPVEIYFADFSIGSTAAVPKAPAGPWVRLAGER